MDGDSNSTKHGFWDFKLYEETEWFKFLAKSLLTILAAYLFFHWGFTLLDELNLTNFKLDYEYAKLDDRQKQIINRIYFDSTAQVSAANNQEPKQATIVKGNSLIDSTFKGGQKKEAIKGKIVNDESQGPPYERVLKFINNEFNDKLDPAQFLNVRAYLMTAPKLEAISYLSDARFQVESYFWLTGPAVYFEIIFWSLFGVLASLLFSLGLVARNCTTDERDPKTVFDSSEIPYQVAKLLYAPLCTLVIILGYNFFSDANIVDISSSNGVVVFAFISGFYSARVVAFLDRLKEVLLPAGAPGSSSNTDTSKKMGADQPGTDTKDDIAPPPLPPEPTEQPGTETPADEPENPIETDPQPEDTRPPT